MFVIKAVAICGNVLQWCTNLGKIRATERKQGGYYEEFLMAALCKSCLDARIKGNQTHMEPELAFVLSFSVTSLQKTNRTGRVV